MMWIFTSNASSPGHNNEKFSLRSLPRLGTCALLFLLAIPVSAQTNSELKQVNNSLQQTEQVLLKNKKQREKTLTDIQSIEKQISERSLRFEQTREKVTTLENQAALLETELEQLATEFELAREALNQLVESAYMMGRQSALKVALSQQGTQHIARLNHYTRSIASARQNQLDALLSLQQQLNEKNHGLEQQRNQLGKLTAALEEDQRYLGNLKENRQAKLNQLDETISSKNQELDFLRARKTRLEKLMAEIAQRQKVRAERKKAQEKRLQAIKNLPPRTSAPPPAARKDGLPLPARARIVAHFGDKREKSGLPWSGILMEGPEGSDIRAISPGEVVYADWLPGYGQMIIVDHGKGLMSLYGHNKRIHRTVGDKVKQSDIIASMGNTAGLHRPALYFEIRQNGVARDPLIWCKG